MRVVHAPSHHADARPRPTWSVAANRVIVAAVGVWLAGVVVVMASLWRYKLEPGAEAASPVTWPAESGLARLPHLPTLVVIAHPRCPCTLATLAELREIMSSWDRRAVAHVVFWTPSDVPAGAAWSVSAAWTAAASIPGVRTSADPGGAEARRFGALTSGHVVLYDAEGRLRFSGGITSARGHAGDNSARDLLLSLLGGAGGPPVSAPVFGCSLEDAKGR